MIDRELLKDVGFELGTGWGHEVWVYEGNFWVHYGGEFSGLIGAQIDGNTADRRMFFEMFLDRVVSSAVNSATYCECRN